MRRAAVALALSPLALAACAAERSPPVVAVEPAPPPVEIKEWEDAATPADRAAISGLPERWTRALTAVPRRGMGRLRAEGPLARPDVALEQPAPSPGPYYCRLLRFGGRLGITTFRPDFCYVTVDAGRLTFTKQTGENLPQGRLYEDEPTRLVFLGTMGPGRYGEDSARDVAGVVERVSPFRWRLTLTRAGRRSRLDLYELVPVTPEVPLAPRAVPARE